MNLGWYAARLRSMSPREYLHRARQSAELKRRAAVAGHWPALRFLADLPELPKISVPRKVRFFDIELPYTAREEIDWHRDYSTGKRAPLRFYGNIDYRNAAQVGDAKYTWELNRHQFMVPWALHFKRTADEADISAIVHLLVSWIAANPKFIGINWSSSLELALRMLSWGIVFDLCGDSPYLEAVRPMVERSVTQQANYIRDTLSLYSSANNHLMGELVGLLAVGVFFPKAPGARQHADFARNGIIREAHLQNFSDGVNREQAIYYHHYTLEYLTTAMALFARARWEFPRKTAELVHKMIGFVDAVVDEHGVPPDIGDRDDGIVTGFNLDSGVGIYESLLWTGWRLFNDESAGAHAAEIARGRGAEPVVDARTAYWHGASDLSSSQFNPPSATVFREGGYAIFTSGRRLRATFRSGPFGYPRIAAHAHCDQLSVCVNLGEHELLADSGTFCYHSDEKWRRYFKGTAAHNTVRVDNLEQAEYAGPFLWATHANSELQNLQTEDSRFRIGGVHSGYRRLPEPVEHSRMIEFSRNESRMLVRDTLGSGTAHKYELIWNFGPDIIPEWANGDKQSLDPNSSYTTAAWHLMASGATLALFTITSQHPFQIAIYHGDENLPAGWYSRQFGKRMPIYQLRISVSAGWWSVDSTLEATIHPPAPFA